MEGMKSLSMVFCHVRVVLHSSIHANSGPIVTTSQGYLGKNIFLSFLIFSYTGSLLAKPF